MSGWSKTERAVNSCRARSSTTLCRELPPSRLERQPIPSRNNPLGMKGVGELGMIGAPPAVINALCDALGIEHLDMPATPERVWRAAQSVSR